MHVEFSRGPFNQQKLLKFIAERGKVSAVDLRSLGYEDRVAGSLLRNLEKGDLVKDIGLIVNENHEERNLPYMSRNYILTEYGRKLIDTPTPDHVLWIRTYSLWRFNGKKI